VHEVSEYEVYGILIGEVVSVTAFEEALDEGGHPISALLGAVVYDGVESSYLKNSNVKLGIYGYSSRE
jgi:hypothetical protein